MKKNIKRLAAAVTAAVFGLAFILMTTVAATVGTIAANMNTTESSYNGELYGDTIPEQVWFFFLSNGFTKEATAGIMGNMQGESGIDPTSIQYPSQAAAGICQWQYYNRQSGRWLNLKKFAAKKGKEWTDLQSQLEFVLHEMQGGESTTKIRLQEYCGGYDNFKALTDVDEAAKVFLNAFERPRNRDATLRQQYAREIYEKYKNLSLTAQNDGTAIFGGDSGSPLGEETWKKIMDEALKYKGRRYVWGGKSPGTGFDCSGLTSWCYRKAGINLTGTAQDQYNATAHVRISEAKPGDLIFFTKTYRTTRYITHVAIYVGDNRIYHAGDPIKYGKLTDSCWKGKIVCAGRIRK